MKAKIIKTKEKLNTDEYQIPIANNKFSMKIHAINILSELESVEI